jgi:hypothetical protein
MKNKNSVVYKYFNRTEYDKTIKIEMIERIDMNEDISYLLDNEYNIKNNVFDKYKYTLNNKRILIKQLSNIKLS